MCRYAYKLQPDHPNDTPATVFRLASAGGPRVLDIGSGPGIVGSALCRLAGRDVTCADIDEDALAAARRAGVGRTVVVDLEQPDWYDEIPRREYDVVILADVLEHLRDPSAVLHTLREQKIVAAEGSVVVSFPNVAHESIVGQLLVGTFSYTENGLLDRTHLRFFTLSTMHDLIEECGFHVEQVHRTFRTMAETVHAPLLRNLSRKARAAIRQTGLEGRTYQYVLLVHPAWAGGHG